MKKDLIIWWYTEGNWEKYKVEDIKHLFSKELNWESIEDIKDCGVDKIEVNYKDGVKICYRDVHGTYGNPVIIK